MNTITESFLATLVKQMREAQVNYFEAIKVAKRTKLPADFAKANGYLIESKNLEKLVDASVDHTIREQREIDRLKAICHEAKIALLDKYEHLGDATPLIKIIDTLNKALPAEAEADSALMPTNIDIKKNGFVRVNRCSKGDTDSRYADVAKFWSVVEELVKSGEIKEDYHFIIQDGKVYMRMNEVYELYAEAIMKRHEPGLNKLTLFQYLERPGTAFISRQKKYFSGQGAQLWCHQFHYAEIGINLKQVY